MLFWNQFTFDIKFSFILPFQPPWNEGNMLGNGLCQNWIKTRLDQTQICLSHCDLILGGNILIQMLSIKKHVLPFFNHIVKEARCYVHLFYKSITDHQQSCKTIWVSGVTRRKGFMRKGAPQKVAKSVFFWWFMSHWQTVS